MTTISANELKTKGISILDKFLDTEEEAIITVHGKPRYIVMPVESYNRLRELELEQAILESQRDLHKNKYHKDLKKHLMKIKK